MIVGLERHYTSHPRAPYVYNLYIVLTEYACNDERKLELQLFVSILRLYTVRIA